MGKESRYYMEQNFRAYLTFIKYDLIYSLINRDIDELIKNI